MKLLSKEIFIPETNGRCVIPCFVTYIDAEKSILMHRISWVDASDTYDDFEDLVSTDNGKTWSKPVLRLKSTVVPEGRLRYAESSGFFDPDTRKLVTITSRVLYPKEKLDRYVGPARGNRPRLQGRRLHELHIPHQNLARPAALSGLQARRG
jgi:hypothetical protein